MIYIYSPIQPFPVGPTPSSGAGTPGARSRGRSFRSSVGVGTTPDDTYWAPQLTWLEK